MECHWCAEAKADDDHMADDDQEGDENINEANRPANVQLESPCQSGSGQARWNVPPGTATAGAVSEPDKASVMPKQGISGSDSAAQPRRSTRTQPARKRKG